MLWIGMLIASASANEIILPDFHGTPGSSEAGPEIVYSAMVEALSDRDLAFLDANDLRTFLGDAAQDCPARSECPGNLWMDIEGELALLGTVTMTDAQITATIEYYRRGIEEPVEIFQADFGAEVASRFAVDAALIAEDVLKMGDELLMTATAPMVAAATISEDALGIIDIAPDLPIPAAPAPPPVAPPAAKRAPEPPPAAAAPIASGRVSSRPMAEDDERRYMGLTKGLYEEFQASNQSRIEFLADKKIRAKAFFVELAPGLVFGDVQRRYSVRTALIQDGPDTFRAIGSYQRDQFLPGTAFSLIAGAGYAPTWWLELGVNVGLEFPRKELITGWEAYGSKSDFENGTLCAECSDQTIFQPATALTFMVEPRVRLVLRPTGLVKPFLVTGWNTRFNDSYVTPDLDKVAYQDRPGVQTYGPMGGLGLGFDPRKRASAFIESTYTHLLGPGILDTGRQYIKQMPVPVEGFGVVMTVRAGVVSRF
jgi:hypothetical protein